MKWYFSISKSSLDRQDHGWVGLTRVAVLSAKENTKLDPILLYDGEEDDFTAEMTNLGVRVILHRVSFYSRLEEFGQSNPGYLSIAAGAFLRVDIPLIEKDDDYVLYTDCDIIFRGEPDLSHIHPEFFAAAPQFSKDNYRDDMNSGVMVINVKSMRQTHSDFCEFICSNIGRGLPGFDQENYRKFYYDKHERLSLNLNWKPYWGPNGNAQIIHWHGPKPQLVQRLLRQPDMVTNSDWRMFVAIDSHAYEQYLLEWRSYSRRCRKSIIGHIDLINQASIIGWAIDLDNPQAVAWMSIHLNGVEMTSIMCRNKRSDIEVLYGAPRSGFNISLKKFDIDNSENTIEFFDLNENIIKLRLNNTPVSKISLPELIIKKEA